MRISKRTKNRVRRAYVDAVLRAREFAHSVRSGNPEPVEIVRLDSRVAYEAYLRGSEAERRKRTIDERATERPDTSFDTPGFCYVCDRWTHFVSGWEFAHASERSTSVNWREHLRCRFCDLNNRTRASLHLLASTGTDSRSARLYVTEQTTPLFARLQRRGAEVLGSEFLRDGTPRGGTNVRGLRNEDLTCLTFADGSFDAILSFDVLEHVPDYSAAFRECARVLTTGGVMLFSVPFAEHSDEHQIRARLRDDGSVEHLVPPEYHGDPMTEEGCLCFQYFGWDLLPELVDAGFSRATALAYYSRDYGYLGGVPLQFLAEK